MPEIAAMLIAKRAARGAAAVFVSVVRKCR